MLTGGIRRKPVAHTAITDGIAMVGLATALAIRLDLPNAWARGEDIEITAPAVRWRSKPLASLAVQSVVKTQMLRLAEGRAPRRCVSPALALIQTHIRQSRRTRQYVAWVEKRPSQGASR